MEHHPTRVLHIFAPNYRHRFGGPIFDWKFAFSHWDNPDVQHLVFDSENRKILEAKVAFDFPTITDQHIVSRWKRIKWIFTLLRLIKSDDNQYDILHFHVLWWAGLFAAVRAERIGIPTLYQSVLMLGDTPSGIAAQKFGKLKIWCLKKFTTILTISTPLTEDYLKFNFQPSRVHTLMNSVDSDTFRPVGSETEKRDLRRKYSLPEEAKILLFVGSIIQRKGVDCLIDAFIAAQQENKHLYLVLVGAWNKQENPSLDECFVHHLLGVLDRKGLGGRVKFMGLVQGREQLAELYRASDIFAFPSRNEGLPNVVLEAMACALPVVVSRLPVLEHVIQDGESGIFIPLEDADALKDAILRIYNDHQLANKIGQTGHEYTVANHSFKGWQSKLVHIYKDMAI